MKYKKYSVIIQNGTFRREIDSEQTMIGAFNTLMDYVSNWTAEEKSDAKKQFERCRKRISKIYKQDSSVAYTGATSISVTIRRYWI